MTRIVSRWLGAMALASLLGLLAGCGAGGGSVTITGGADPTTLSNIAFLAGVDLSSGDSTRQRTEANGTPIPGTTDWSTNVFYYSYTVSSTVSEITIRPRAQDTSQPPTIRVSGGGLTSVVVASFAESPPISLGALNSTTTITIQVTAADSRTQQNYTLRVKHLSNTASNLANLTLSNSAVLSPTFNTATLDYTTTVAFNVTSLTATITPQDSSATVTVNGTSLNVSSGQGTTSAIPLSIATPTTLAIHITATDGITASDYTVTITREGSAALTNLTINKGVIIEDTNPSTCTAPYARCFSSEQDYFTTQVTVTPTKQESTATISNTLLNGSVGASTPPSLTITLCDPGPCDTTLLMDVTSSNGTTTASYILTLHHAGPPPYKQDAYIKASDTAALSHFGYSMARDGDTLVVGAYSKNSGKGAVYVFTLSGGTWTQQGSLLTGDTAASGDNVGWSVALSGDTLAAGAPFHNNGQGAVYVFTRSAGVWTERAYLKASNGDDATDNNTNTAIELGDQFGTSVALDGDTLVVGAPYEASNTDYLSADPSNNSLLGSGAVYVFTRSAGVWTERAYLKASNTTQILSGLITGYLFGTSVALDGGTLAVGAPAEDGGSNGVNLSQAQEPFINADSGAVYVFTGSAATWTQQAYVKAFNTSNLASGDLFGASLALAGDTLAVGSPGENGSAAGITDLKFPTVTLTASPSTVTSGNGTTLSWTTANVTSCTASGAWSGSKATTNTENLLNLTTTGTYTLTCTGSNGTASDAVRVTVNPLTPAPTITVTANPTTIVSGARTTLSWTTSNVTPNSCTASGGTWSGSKADADSENVRALSAGTLTYALTCTDANTTSVSNVVTVTVLPAPPRLGSFAASGAAHLFTRSGGIWTEQTYVKASNPGISDGFGTSVALSPDSPDLLLVGAPGEDSNATGVDNDTAQTNNGASAAGAAYLFSRDGGDWVQAYIKASNTEAGDGFGRSVALSGADATLMAVIGADGEASNSTDIGGDQSNNSASIAGAVYVFVPF